MFVIRVWYNQKNQPDAIGIKCKNRKKQIVYNIQNKPLNKGITYFVVDVVFQHDEIARIVEY